MPRSDGIFVNLLAGVSDVRDGVGDYPVPDLSLDCSGNSPTLLIKNDTKPEPDIILSLLTLQSRGSTRLPSSTTSNQVIRRTPPFQSHTQARIDTQRGAAAS